MKEKVFRQLCRVLADLYGDVNSALRVAKDAGLDPTHIKVSTRAIDNWDAILEEAEHQRLVEALLEIAVGQYPREQKLQDARRDYDAWVAAGRPDGDGGPEPTPHGPAKVSLARLPSTHPDLFGRKPELALLDAAWADPQVNVLCLVAWGGVGKTALVNRWLLDMGPANYHGAERVLGWSFYSQGAAEGRQVSADPFIAHALDWFGDPDPAHGTPWDKGERLAELVKQRRTLLILDGLEPLQNPPPVEIGRIKDPGLCCLLRELARHNPGLCIVTTRLPVDDLKDFSSGTAVQKDLEHLSPEAGAAYLKHLGVKGTQAELRQASREFGGHALALTLLGSLLRDAYDGDVRCRKEVGPLEGDAEHGGHAAQVMASYERWFGEGPERAILWMMGLFDRPAEGGALAALRAPPPIPGLTDLLFHASDRKGLGALFRPKVVEPLSDQEWTRAVAVLRRARLLAARDPAQPDTLDCHPLVREHFGEGLRAGNPKAWQEAHGRLYEYYKSRAPEYPDTVEEMAPLYAAVAHGCQAGRHQEAYDQVYCERIRRWNEHFSLKKLGAFGSELAVLSGFFDPPWRRTMDNLREDTKASVLNQAGSCLGALGRLAEAAQPMQAGLEARIAQKDWGNAAIGAGNLSELTLTAGDLAQAVRYAEQSVALADRSGEAFLRMGFRTTLAETLHQAGRTAEAEALFRQAEALQQERQPGFPLLYSLWGYRYCDLLLDQGQWVEVLRRVGQTLEWAEQQQKSLLDIALQHLSLGRASLLQAQAEGTGNFSTAAAHLDRAMDGLRRAGQQDELPFGLLARAALRRVTQDYRRARADLEEALSIATRGGMRLHEADCHLEFARLHLACGEGRQAQASLDKAKAMIQAMGYHRRDGEVAELEAALRDDGGSPAE
jgi:tetratricopeptide (TPR) repeat protein